MMKTRRFTFFCVPAELSRILSQSLRERGNATMFAEIAPPERGLCPVSLHDLSLTRAKVLWAAVDGGKPTTFLGLVQIVLPRYRDKVLCMASIAIKAESSDESFKASIELYLHLKKSVSKGLKRHGVWGVNAKYGGEQFYKDIYVSDGALSECFKGYELGPEGGDGFVRFEYRAANSGSS